MFYINVFTIFDLFKLINNYEFYKNILYLIIRMIFYYFHTEENSNEEFETSVVCFFK